MIVSYKCPILSSKKQFLEFTATFTIAIEIAPARPIVAGQSVEQHTKSFFIPAIISGSDSAFSSPVLADAEA